MFNSKHTILLEFSPASVRALLNTGMNCPHPQPFSPGRMEPESKSLSLGSYGVHRSRLRLRIRRSGPPNPPILGGIRVQSPPELMLLANLTLGNIGAEGREGSLRPPSPQFWGSRSSKSHKVGGFRGPSDVLTILRNNSPAASILGDFEL